MMKSLSLHPYFCRLAATTVLLLCITLGMGAHHFPKDYTVKRGIVFYQDYPLRQADAGSFIELGHGYAKDRYFVYYHGQVLPYVDPFTFRLKPFSHQQYSDEFGWYDEDMDPMRYIVTSNTVLFQGREVQGASSMSFKDLGDGYGQDAFNVYYMGKKMKDASSISF
ncbi:MAG TPA: DKNYY domain-containing protein, partial [Prevotella sp.]